MADWLHLDISDADVKRIQAVVLDDEAKILRRTVRKVKTGDPKGDIARSVAGYLESRAKMLRLEADKLEDK